MSHVPAIARHHETLPDASIIASEPLVLTIEEAALCLRVSRTMIYALLNAGEIRSIQIGRARRIPFAELQRYVGRKIGGATGDSLERALSHGGPRE